MTQNANRMGQTGSVSAQVVLLRRILQIGLASGILLEVNLIGGYLLECVVQPEYTTIPAFELLLYWRENFLVWFNFIG